MKIIRSTVAKPAPSRPIKCFPEVSPNPPPPAHPTVPASNAIARHAVTVASSPGKINPKQMVF
jgi:hypothetical protein